MTIDYSAIEHGDMPGDKIQIGDDHLRNAERILPLLLEELERVEQGRDPRRAVVAVYGGSGVGKSEIASLLGYMLGQEGHPSYVMSGDNYPHRIPKENDAKRQEVYESGGQDALRAYLGSPQEIEFERVDAIVKDFKAGAQRISLKRMGREVGELWYDEVDFSDIEVLIIEWTHGNSDHFTGVDIPIFLHSTPEETLAHRKARARDGNVDSPFTTLVLSMEQELLDAQAPKAKIIVTKSGDIIDFDTYKANYR